MARQFHKIDGKIRTYVDARKSLENDKDYECFTCAENNPTNANLIINKYRALSVQNVI